MYTNVDTLSNKSVELVSYITLNNIQIIGLCETRPKNSIYDYTEINIPNYDKISPSKPGKRGVILYVHQSLHATDVELFEDIAFDESVWCSIKLREDKDRLLIGCVYRSPNSTPENNDNLHTLINRAGSSKYSHILIVGDFNYKEIEWEKGTTDASENHPATKFHEFIQDNYLFQHIRKETHHRENQNPSLLDLIFTNEEEMISKEDILYDHPLGNSDHCMIVFDFRCYLETEESQEQKFRFFKGDYGGLVRWLEGVEWDTLLSSDPQNVNSNWIKFKMILQEAMQLYIPKTSKQGKHNKKPIWMNKQVAIELEQKRKKWCKYWYSRSYRNYEIYKIQRNTCTKIVREAKINYEKMIANDVKINPKSFWKYVKRKTKVRTGVGELIKPDGTLTKTDEDKVTVLNDFFNEVYTRLDDMIEQPENGDKPLKTINKIDISIKEINKKLATLDTNKSPGPDGIHPKVLTEARDVISLPLQIIFTQSLETGIVPDDWRIAHVIPIFKKGDKKKPGNYRPVSLTAIIIKVLESIIRDRIVHYMETNDLFTKYQFGFRKRRSCVTQLLEVLETWSKSLDEGLPLDVIYLDFSKAFDKIPHQRLGIKMKKYGIEGTLWQWILNFLKDRKQRVVYKNYKSNWKDVVSGVPQGSVLGPILFLIFINDIPEVVNGYLRIFADDTKVFNTVQNEERCRQLQHDLDNLCEWSEKWGLKFNTEKCKVIHHGKNNQEWKYYMNNGNLQKELCEETEEKDLGVTFESGLFFKKHIQNCAKKGNQLLGMIKRSFDYMDEDMFMTLYKTLVRPVLEYATSVWNPHLKKDIMLIEKVQRRATKLVAKLKNMNYEVRLQTLGLPTLEYRRDRSDMIQLFRIITQIDDLEFNHFFQINTNETRGHSYKIFKNRCFTTQRKYSFSQRTVNNWNNLTEEIVTSKNINAFKRALNNTPWNKNKFTPST